MKVFLKFNRSDSSAIVCLTFWLELFRNYEIIINCDLFVLNRDPVPQYLTDAISGRNTKLINSDYTTGDIYTPYMKSKKRRMASANLTCFQHLDKSDKYFWVIDADDTMFLFQNYSYIQQKLANAENYAIENNLDGFSLDFYREYNNTWTFGVCLLRADIDWKKISTISGDDLNRYNLSMNSDSIFDYLGRKNVFKLKSFVFENLSFQHLINKHVPLPNGIYYWHNKKIWDKPLHTEVVVL